MRKTNEFKPAIVNQQVVDRLRQYEFGRAYTYARMDPNIEPEELELIEALAETYGDPGWSLGGYQTVILRWTLLGLGIDIDD